MSLVEQVLINVLSIVLLTFVILRIVLEENNVKKKLVDKQNVLLSTSIHLR